MTGDQRTPAELADAAYEAMRSLNHATQPWAPDDLDDLYRMLGSLAALLHITPQALDQTGLRVARAGRQGRVGVDAASPAGPVEVEMVMAIQRALDGAGRAVTEAARDVDAAHEAAAHLIVAPTDEPRWM